LDNDALLDAQRLGPRWTRHLDYMTVLSPQLNNHVDRVIAVHRLDFVKNRDSLGARYPLPGRHRVQDGRVPTHAQEIQCPIRALGALVCQKDEDLHLN
jgi:hypothetical protein